MPLYYIISATFMKLFVFFITIKKKEETLLSFSNLEEIMEHRACHGTGTGKNSNIAPSAPVRVEPED
jgi:hypothetical protein